MDKISKHYAYKHISIALPLDYRSDSMIEKIYQKLDMYGHLSYHPINEYIFFHQYVKYYICGIFDDKDFDEIICDPAFHFTEFDKSKDFFLQVYFGNKFLQKKYKNTFNKNANQNVSDYEKWMIENFKKYYKIYHKDVKS